LIENAAGWPDQVALFYLFVISSSITIFSQFQAAFHSRQRHFAGCIRSRLISLPLAISHIQDTLLATLADSFSVFSFRDTLY